jgi:hypothetical protein
MAKKSRKRQRPVASSHRKSRRPKWVRVVVVVVVVFFMFAIVAAALGK